MVMEALKLFSQDRTGLADYALESGGRERTLVYRFVLTVHFSKNNPAFFPPQPDVHPGNCWAFRGSTGFLVIQLSMKILPTAVTMEHVPKSLAPSGTLRSAPRDFSVYVRDFIVFFYFQGLKDEDQDRGKLLGNYTYDEDGEDLQMFIISVSESLANVLSNWGHPEYTCMYRFRVHGLPSDV
uniref:SUN domain-containing protein n=1 Tax=Xiphophorus couchianus TaxID=32473 RepID=A0A3B5L092_9TELE